MLPILFDRVRFSSLIWRRRGPVAAHFVRIILSYIAWLAGVARRGIDRSSLHLRYGISTYSTFMSVRLPRFCIAPSSNSAAVTS